MVKDEAITDTHNASLLNRVARKKLWIDPQKSDNNAPAPNTKKYLSERKDTLRVWNNCIIRKESLN